MLAVGGDEHEDTTVQVCKTVKAAMVLIPKNVECGIKKMARKIVESNIPIIPYNINYAQTTKKKIKNELLDQDNSALGYRNYHVRI